MEGFVPILKDAEQEHPVPSSWRAPLSAIVQALRDGNDALTGLPGVAPLDAASAAAISRNISDYGCTLIALPEASWDTSVCSWQLDHWEVLVDLFTIEEGASDLVMHVLIREVADDVAFSVHLVYVP